MRCNYIFSYALKLKRQAVRQGLMLRIYHMRRWWRQKVNERDCELWQDMACQTYSHVFNPRSLCYSPRVLHNWSMRCLRIKHLIKLALLDDASLLCESGWMTLGSWQRWDGATHPLCLFVTFLHYPYCLWHSGVAAINCSMSAQQSMSA